MNTSLPVPNTKQRGDAAEQRALRHLLEHGLTLLATNYRTPGRGGGEIDLIVRECDGTLVFVEVRARARDDFGSGCQHQRHQAQTSCVRGQTLFAQVPNTSSMPL